MSIISTEKPESLYPEEKKVLSIANSDYPLLSIDHRRFEKLCYWLYRAEIEHGEWKGRYDDIRLMSGVRDGAKDCAMYNGIELTGIIQCKHSDNDKALEAPLFSKEIIKFALYCQLETIISDVSKFVYFIASSSGFNQDTLNLIDDFRNKFTLQEKFQKWTESVIRGSVALKHLKYADVEVPLKSLLNNLSVKKIDNEDINKILQKNHQVDTVKAFFEIKTVIDPKAIEPLTESVRKIEKSISNSAPTVGKAEKEFKDASIFLTNWISHIHPISKIEIERREVNQVVTWLQTPLLTESNVCILSGEGGYGKTVIMKNIYDALQKVSIPVLGIKCDHYYESSIGALEKAMGLTHSILDSIEILLTEHNLVVVIIDQIDALSQSLSSNRQFLNTYLLLIQKLSRLQGVRVVISSRTFDLEYDPGLKALETGKNILVGLLSENEVTDTLKKLGITTPESLPSNVLTILRSPSNLQVFSNIYHPGLQLNVILGVQDLFYELWLKVLVRGVEPDESKGYEDCLYAIAEAMNSRQQIVVDRVNFEFKYHQQLSFLLSNGLLVQNGTTLQFFHQTFYDYTYARNFVERDNDLYQYVLDNAQTLHIRASVRMILSYLRVTKEQEYIKTLESLLISKEIRFHIKLMLINGLGYLQNPLKSEASFVKNFILANKELKLIFLESVYGKFWFDFLIGQNVLADIEDNKETRLDWFLRKRIPFKAIVIRLLETRFGYKDLDTRVVDSLNLRNGIFFRALPEGRQSIAKYLIGATLLEGEDWLVARVLYSIKIWDCAELFELFEKYSQEITKNSTMYFHILENMVPYNVDLALAKIHDVVTNAQPYFNTSDRTLHNHNLLEAFKVAAKHSPEKTFQAGLTMVRELAIKGKAMLDEDDDGLLYDDLYFAMFHYDREHHREDHGIYSELIEICETFSKSQDTQFDLFFQEAKQENSIAVLRILAFGLAANPIAYKEKILEFFQALHEKDFYNEGGGLQWEVISLVGKIYAEWNQLQKDVFNKFLVEIKDASELAVYGSPGNRNYDKKYGMRKYRYLLALPRKEVMNQPTLRKTFLELERKFKKDFDRKSDYPKDGFIGSPLTPNAYENMTFEQWESSFEKYADESNFHSGLLEHSRAFGEAVKKSPAKFYSFVDKLISENKVTIDYWIKGLEGLKDSGHDPKLTLVLFKKVIKHDIDRENTLYLIWITDIFINTQVADDEVIDFLCYQVRHHADPSHRRNLGEALTDGINSVRGAAIYRLVQCTFNHSFKERIFSAAERAASDTQISVRAALIAHMARLLHFDKKRTVEIFLKATEIEDESLLTASINSLQYLVHHDFKSLRQRLKKWIEIEPLQENLGAILMWCWTNNYKGSKRIFQKVLKQSSKARAMVIRGAYENLFHKEERIRSKCNVIIRRFLNDNSKEVVHQYNLVFLQLKEKPFIDLLPFMQEYSQSRVARIDPQYFLEYLAKYSVEYPSECLSLLTNVKPLPRPNISQGPHYDDEPMAIVMNAYNSFMNADNKKSLLKSISVFDRMLKVDFLRTHANRALQMIDK